MGDPMTETPSPALDELWTTRAAASQLWSARRRSDRAAILDQAAAALVAAKVDLVAWPTGLAVVRPMHQGRTWPASTSTRANSVGARAIQRRPTSVEYRQWRQDLLPPELQTNNPLGTAHDTRSYSNG